MNERLKIHVVAAAIEDARGHVLIAQRPTGKHMAGAWEFPGGKLESGEAPLEALARELHEELGIEVGSGPHRPVRRISHSYPDRDVLIDVWRVREFVGMPRGMDAQALRWCTPDELERAELLPADKPIVAALRLPEILVSESTDVYSIGERRAAKQLGMICGDINSAAEAENGGADFVLMRSAPADSALSQVCETLLIPVFTPGISLNDAWRLGASGIHRLESAVISRR